MSYSSEVKLKQVFRGASLDVEVSLDVDEITSILEDLNWDTRSKIALDILDTDAKAARDLADSLNINERIDLIQELLNDLTPAERDSIMGWHCNHCAERENIRYAVDEIEDDQ